MAQFDVRRNANLATRDSVPYLVELQHDLLGQLTSRVVVPLVPTSDIPRPISRLNPVFRVEGAEVVMSTQELAGVPSSALGEQLGTLAERRDDIIAALDLLFTGI